MAEYFVVASLPAIQRDLFLSRCLRREKDAPKKAETLRIEWSDMVVNFASDEAISECSVEVLTDISLPIFTRRLESLLDCAAKSESLEWTMKWADRISRYGELVKVRAILCDKIASIDGQSGETIGVLKIKRRSVKSGHAKVRLVPTEDSLQVICRHTNAQGLKSVWKSVIHRLRPQYPREETKNQNTVSGPTILKGVAPCVLVKEDHNGYYYNGKASWLSEQGISVDLSKEINVTFPMNEFIGESLPYYTANFYCCVELRHLPAGKPADISIDKNKIEICTSDWEAFYKRAAELSSWLNLGWNLESA